MVSITPEQKIANDQKMAALFERLLLVDCRAESKDALKYEGVAGFQSSFEVLGKAATMGLMTDPHAAASMTGFASYLDRDKLNALFKEAGITPKN